MFVSVSDITSFEGHNEEHVFDNAKLTEIQSMVDIYMEGVNTIGQLSPNVRLKHY